MSPLIERSGLWDFMRWVLFIPAAFVVWVCWQMLLANTFYSEFGGFLRGGITWIEGTAEGICVLVAAAIAPTSKRVVASVSVALFVLRDVVVVVSEPLAEQRWMS